ncbi:hypothetical protein SAMN06265349_105106 [Flavobacterium resistens]|uniref:Uncharacterized protein n=1 Tax=Flavobacterium resistens TaxID=443612 RepID=A0A521ENA2_9FLAO|nr:hypothetical protein [Flavobacterium resistens]MRX67734.1 hypothetical protein [Flavobacterium resistens]SMO85383.1 hypothetical protein SAMN06265349_105106 [Flavobacterium resistens]
MIGKREKRKRIFYVPGMISLVFIPLFCFYHFYKVDAFKIYNAIELGMPNKSDFEKYKVAALRNYRVFSFDGSNLDGNTKLNEVKLYLRKMVVDKDTVNGAKIHFGSKTYYETFIRIIDIIDEEKAPTWTINNNDIYILGSRISYKEVKDTTKHYRMNCDTGAIMAKQRLWMRKNEREEEECNFQVSFFKQKWRSLSLGYLGLVILNIIVLVKLNKTKIYNQK